MCTCQRCTSVEHSRLGWRHKRVRGCFLGERAGAVEGGPWVARGAGAGAGDGRRAGRCQWRSRRGALRGPAPLYPRGRRQPAGGIPGLERRAAGATQERAGGSLKCAWLFPSWSFETGSRLVRLSHIDTSCKGASKCRDWSSCFCVVLANALARPTQCSSHLNDAQYLPDPTPDTGARRQPHISAHSVRHAYKRPC